jgi:hypothetical protein
VLRGNGELGTFDGDSAAPLRSGLSGDLRHRDHAA